MSLALCTTVPTKKTALKPKYHQFRPIKHPFPAIVELMKNPFAIIAMTKTAKKLIAYTVTDIFSLLRLVFLTSSA